MSGRFHLWKGKRIFDTRTLRVLEKRSPPSMAGTRKCEMRNRKPSYFAVKTRILRSAGGVTVAAATREMRKPRQWLAQRESGLVQMDEAESKIVVSAVRRIAELRFKRVMEQL